MACCSAALHHPLGFSLTPCSASRAPPRIQRVGVATPSVASVRPLSRARISPRCTYSGGASAAPGPGELPAAALRRVLEMPGAHQAPACYDALSARLVERAEFRACFTSGIIVSCFVSSCSCLEKEEDARFFTESHTFPLQVSPKACGHTQGRKVVSREEAIMHIKAAVDARNESGSDIVIVARTDSRQAVSLNEALWRVRAFADAGADVLFIDALASREEMKAFCAIAPGVPKMANMLEGGGKTPILSPVELEEIGYKIIAYPLSLIGVSMRAMEDALIAIKGGRIPPPSSLPTFEEIKNTLGFNHYYEEDKRYAVTPAQSLYGTGYDNYTSEPNSPGDSRSRAEKTQEPVIDILPQLYDIGSSDSRGPSTGMWSRTLRLKITGRDGIQKIDARIPAGFLEGMTRIIPGLAGANIMERLRNAPVDTDNPQNGQILLDFEDAMGDRIQVFIA
ncbi:2,3-dimethylmalate lyase [Zea mays]|uniref:2,3-dimethylmalate lyase n=1 Tax=Zea mays TaxID=4577 RepID=A0A3L6G7D7_MAIZE|nr:2,3-dimethylmalate lyase [Zea mays]